MGFSINDSVYSSVFFFLTGLHFFHVVVGIILISILFWSCSYNYIYSQTFLLSEVLYESEFSTGRMRYVKNQIIWIVKDMIVEIILSHPIQLYF